MKTKSGAKKRFRLTASGKVRAGRAFRSHMMSNKSQKMKRQSRNGMTLFEGDAAVVLRNWLPGR